MSELSTKLRESGNIKSPLPSYPATPSTSSNKISPVVIYIIIVLAVIFFVSGILHLLIRFLMKRPSFYPSVSQPIRPHNDRNSSSDALQRQLQQLFRLHDSGLDQALIDALPVFFYKDIMGLKEPFDCAVCLCEFSEQDKLRLLPFCSHAFHISCIDTWLLSNSTCPLCRGSLLSAGLENQEFSLDYWRELSFGRSIDRDCSLNGHSFNLSNKPTIMEENASERRVFSVRLGKFKCLSDGVIETGNEQGNGEACTVASTSSQIDARRCYSLGSYQYVLADTNLEVALSSEIGASSGNVSSRVKLEKMMEESANHMVDGDVEGKKISRRNRGESFSVSKIWLWPKKGRLRGSSDTDVDTNGGPLFNVVLPLSTRDHIP